MGEFGTALQALSLSLLLLLRPLPSPLPLRAEKGANEGVREGGRRSLRMKHDVDSCNFAMDIVMWEAHAKATHPNPFAARGRRGKAGGERKMKSGNSFEAAAVDIFSHFGE